jgi:hypothetical protein
MSVGNYVVGVLLAFVSVRLIAMGARRLRRAALHWLRGPVAASALLIAAMRVIALEVAGVIGALDRLGTVLACIAGTPRPDRKRLQDTAAWFAQCDSVRGAKRSP